MDFNGAEGSYKNKPREEYGPDVLIQDNKSEGLAKNMIFILCDEEKSGAIKYLNEENDAEEIIKGSRFSNEEEEGLEKTDVTGGG